jgi:hypothetical protein
LSDRIYQGILSSEGGPEVFVIDNTTRRTLKQQLVLHGALEFDWGYAGKGPEDLALALLADALEGGDDPYVDMLWRRFLDETVSRLPSEGWQIKQRDVVAWVYGRISRVPVHPLPLGEIGGGVPVSPN